MDFVSVWKASSIVLTGAFGILGLLTEFRNKDTNRITRWGWLALGGIVLSTTLGTAAQLKESADDAKKALKLAEQSDETLSDIKRAMSPLTPPTVSVTFRIDCNDSDLKEAPICINPKDHIDDVTFFMVLFRDKQSADKCQSVLCAGDLTLEVSGKVEQVRWLRLFGQVFRSFKWKDCSASRRRGCGNVKIGFIDFQGLVGRAENSSIVFRPFHETGISTACLIAR
jgi:hypothetical protein